MRHEQFRATKLQLDKEKAEIESTVRELVDGKRALEKRKKEQEEKFSRAKLFFEKNNTVKASFLQGIMEMNMKFLKKYEKEIEQLDVAISAAEQELKKIEEREKYLEQIKRKNIEEDEKRKKQKEENLLFEYFHELRPRRKP